MLPYHQHQLSNFDTGTENYADITHLIIGNGSLHRFENQTSTNMNDVVEDRNRRFKLVAHTSSRDLEKFGFFTK
jgi:hypothetical protein